MLTGISASICDGYTGADHLIDSSDRLAATNAVTGVEFHRAADAVRAAEHAYMASCDIRVAPARVEVTLRTARGDVVVVP